MYCQECGTQLPEEAMFCPDCGTRQALGSIGIEPSEQEKIIKIIR